MAALDPATRRWVESATGSEVVAATRLVGGISSRVDRCELGDGRSVVVRHIDDAAWLAREPYLIEAEATALDLLRPTSLPAPTHLASDADGGRLVMSLLPGHPVVDADQLRSTIGRLVDVAAAVGSIEPPATTPLPRWRTWAPAAPSPPAWGTPSLWEQAIVTHRAVDRPDHLEQPTRLLHRDLHPLNVLWVDGEITGVVDWVNACAGHPHAELYHCRWNLAVLAGQDLADDFLDRYLAATESGPYDRRWDLETPLSLCGARPDVAPPTVSAWHALGRTDLTPAAVIAATERFLEAALDQR